MPIRTQIQTGRSRPCARRKRKLLFAAGALLASAADEARADPVAFVCTNPNSGAMWSLSVDFDRRMVDSFPARITDRRITWQDTLHGGVYELDRRSGELTVRFASSTGGYFLHDRCGERR